MELLFAQAPNAPQVPQMGAGLLVVNGLAVVLGLVSLVCFIMVLIKMFQNDQTVAGILSICICPLIAFVMGWMNADKWGIKNIMLAWTGVIVGSIILNIVAVSMGGAMLSQFGGQ